MEASQRLRPHVTVIAHMVHEDLVDGLTVHALCGEPITINVEQSHDATESGNYVVCPLCEAAQLLADVQIPHLEQGELFS
jgi:hypothetical protein